MPQKLANVINYFKSTKNKFISLEVCPNRELDLERLAALHPPFCSITWLDNDLRHIQSHPSMTLANKLQKNGTSVLLHLPGRILSAETAKDILDFARKEGVTGIFALQGESALLRGLDAVPNEFRYAVDLINFIKQSFDDEFSIAVTGYPDGHPKAESLQTDLNHLKAKVDAGADFIISQSVFDTGTFRLFYQKCRDLGITAPILPGIYIINSYEALMNMKKFCKLSIPEDILAFVNDNSEDGEVVREYGVGKAAEIIGSLLKDEETTVLGVHIFSLNDFDLVKEVFQRMEFINVDLSSENINA